MYSRHRSPGNGYRSSNSTMGMPPPASSPRISPDNNDNNNNNNSIRGGGPSFYNPPSDYRNFNHRAFGRGHPRPYHHPPPPRKGDLFMEAGRLAAEFLVSKCLLPPTVLPPPPKWPNPSFKKQAADFQDFRPHEAENTQQLPPEGRMSALARLGNPPVPDATFSTRRRFADDYNPSGSRNSLRGRRRMGSFRNHDSDWDREYSRTGSWSDKPKTSPYIDDSVSEHQGGLDIGGGGVQIPHPSELAPKCEDAGGSESYSCKLQSLDDVGSKSSASDIQEEIPLETDREITKGPDVMKSLNTEIEDMEEGSDTDVTEKHISSRDLLSVQNGELGGYSGSKIGTDLLRLCNYAKVPTRTRSSLAYRGSKVDTLTAAEGEITSDYGPPIGLVVNIDDNETVDGCLSDELSSYNPHALNGLDSDEKAHSAPSEKDAGDSAPANAVEQGKCLRSQSFPDKALIHGQESSQQMAGGFGRCSSMDSMVKERGEKRAIQHMDMEEASKRPREWFPSMVTQADEYSNFSSFNEKQLSLPEERASLGEELVMAVDEDNSVDISLIQKGVGEPSIEYAEEKHLLPSSFKICDLNLIEVSDMNENQDRDSILIYPSISENKTEAASIDIDLSISNNCDISNEHDIHATDSKEVEVIDLDNDSAEEDKGFSNSERKTDSVYPGLESFPGSESTSDIPDAQDGYGLMISELLGNDIPNCSSVPADNNSLQNEIVLHNGAEILSDDDPIYMSLGEIPISFMRVWEQPTQEYEKPF